MPSDGGLRVAVVGKGGAGKSLTAGTLARLLARRGRRVLALDSDLMPGLEISLGVRPPAKPPLLEAAERAERGWRLKPGLGPVRAAQRCSVAAPDGVRLLQCGKTPPEGLPGIMPAVQAYFRVIHGIAASRTYADWDLIGDLPAGPRQVAFDWAPYADRLVVVVEPTVQSLLAARRTIRVGTQRSQVSAITVVANKVRRDADVERIEAFLREPVAVAVPRDAEVEAAERAGAPLLDAAPGCAAVEQFAVLAELLIGSSLEAR